MKILLSLLVFISGLFSAAYAESLPIAPGQLYDIGGYQLHMQCMGEGSPNVIIDTGLGDDSSDWQAILQQSAQISRTCIYDRAGYGWSDFGHRPRDSRRIAYELELLLNQAHIAPPYVLVGHSFGGYNMRLFAAAHPNDVAGLVLVDSSHELQYNKLNIHIPRGFQRGNTFIRPVMITDDHKNQIFRDRAYRTASYEISALYLSSKQVQAYGSIPPVPLVVISRGQAEWYGTENAQHREQIWLELQQDLTRLSPISQHIFAHHSGHNIPQQQPEIIIGAISDVTTLARAISSP